jgi:ubiquinone/menaquinone biosynthesis C-methylase UbiE
MDSSPIKVSPRLSDSITLINEAKLYLAKESTLPGAGNSYQFELVRSVKRSKIDERLALCSMLITTRKVANVVELNCGAGELLLALSKKYPKVEFIGIDEDPPVSFVPNLTFYKSSLHDLKMIPDQSTDLVLSFNALAYSLRIEHTLSESYRILRDRGIILSFDMYITNSMEDYDSEVLTAVEEIQNLWHCVKILVYPELCFKLTQVGFVIQGEEDFTNRIMPQLREMSLDSYRYHKSQLGPLWRRMVSKSSLEKAFGGMLINDLASMGVIQIRLLVAGRPDTLA